MTQLSDKLQRATEGSREISDAMLLACGWKRHAGNAWCSPAGEWCNWKDRPDPCRNLQDAVSLVPEGWYTVHAGQNPMSGTWYWGIGCNAGLIDSTAHNAESNHETKSPALALCIAIIKAFSKAEAA